MTALAVCAVGEDEREDGGQGGDDDGAAGAEDGELLVDLDADGGGDRPAERPDRRRGRRARPGRAGRAGGREHERLGGADGEAADGALDDQRGEAGVRSRRPPRRRRGRPSGRARWRRSTGRRAAGAGRSAHAWTAPRTAPVTRPPTRAATRPSTGPTSSSAANPPSGKPTNVTIQRAAIRIDAVRCAVGGAVIVAPCMVAPWAGEWWRGRGGAGFPCRRGMKQLSTRVLTLR